MEGEGKREGERVGGRLVQHLQFSIKTLIFNHIIHSDLTVNMASCCYQTSWASNNMQTSLFGKQ